MIEDKLEKYYSDLLHKNMERYVKLEYILPPWVGEPVSCFNHQKEYRAIDKMINEADDAECLTSRYKYVREVKKWQLNRKNKPL